MYKIKIVNFKNIKFLYKNHKVNIKSQLLQKALIQKENFPKMYAIEDKTI